MRDGIAALFGNPVSIRLVPSLEDSALDSEYLSHSIVSGLALPKSDVQVANNGIAKLWGLEMFFIVFVTSEQ